MPGFKCRQKLNFVFILSDILAHSNFCLLFFGRHIIAALYFNLNLFREVKKSADGTQQVKVVWPKFKNGEAAVRDVKVKPNFGKYICTCRFKYRGKRCCTQTELGFW